jgi:hypothetical protein
VIAAIYVRKSTDQHIQGTRGRAGVRLGAAAKAEQ